MIINLTYFHVADHVPNINPDVAVVIDVLRATTTISWALKNGADSIKVFADLELLKTSAMKWDIDKRLMLGERGGKKIEGFDLGNSPLSVTKKVVNGKRLFMSTTMELNHYIKYKMQTIYLRCAFQIGRLLLKKLCQ